MTRITTDHSNHSSNTDLPIFSYFQLWTSQRTCKHTTKPCPKTNCIGNLASTICGSCSEREKAPSPFTLVVIPSMLKVTQKKESINDSFSFLRYSFFPYESYEWIAHFYFPFLASFFLLVRVTFHIKTRTEHASLRTKLWPPPTDRPTRASLPSNWILLSTLCPPKVPITKNAVLRPHSLNFNRFLVGSCLTVCPNSHLNDYYNIIPNAHDMCFEP